MKPNRLRELLKSGKPSIGTRVDIVWPGIVEVIGHTGLFDYVEFLGEYAPFGLQDLDNFAMAAMIKVDQDPRIFLAQRAIGSGFQAINFADCRSAEDVRHCVRIVRPETPEDGGLYGVGARRFAFMGQAGSPDYVQALRDVVIMVMIEKGSTVAQLEEVLSVPGLDMVQWGASDYSMSIGRAGQRNHPDVTAAHDKVFQMALRAGVQPRVEIGNVDQAKRYLDMGVRHFSLSTDIYILYSWWREYGENLRKALEGY